jgi:4-hydroxybenzoate polyprenyltransferase
LSESYPLCLDLDHSLLRTDLLYESFISAIKNNPLCTFGLIYSLFRGRASLKSYLAKRAIIDLKLLPKNHLIEDFAKIESKSRRVYLVTATNEKLAQEFTKLNPWIYDFLSSNETSNLKGSVKRDLLISKFGIGNFDYLGDSNSDLAIWSVARRSYIVKGSKSLVKKCSKYKNIREIFPLRKFSLIPLLKGLRIHQWVKNLLIFLPLIASHNIYNINLWISSFAAFLVFSLTASSVYLLNDLSDLESDRTHRSKKKRPLASGDLLILHALIIIPFLLTIALTLGLALATNFALVLGIYFTLTCLYSFKFKREPVLDIVFLASLYTIRIYAGSAATGIPVSSWLLSFSMFIFLSLACAKRVAEISIHEDEKSPIPGRGYYKKDKDIIANIGVSGGIVSVMVLALYVTAQEVVALYNAPELLLFTCPLVLYWISSIWLVTWRGQLDDDPIVYALKDKASYIIGILVLLVLVLAKKTI